MADLVEELLRINGPSLSTDLAARLQKIHGHSPAAARKRISRPSANVKRLAYLPFRRNARFLYLKSDFGSPKYWENLIHALLANKSAYGLALSALQQRGGIIPAKHFLIACGAPRQDAANRLQRWRQLSDEPNEAHRAVQVAGAAFEAAADSAPGLTAVTWLGEQAIRYQQIKDRPAVARVEQAIRARAEQARGEMTRISVRSRPPPKN
jgi:hypothetical protein